MDIPPIEEPPPRKRRRPKRLRARRPEVLTIDQILGWADEFHAKHGRWPRYQKDGAVAGTVSETWRNLDGALSKGVRGLPGRSSLAQLLEERRGVRNPANLPSLTIEEILSWADAYHRFHGRWPRRESGEIAESANTWTIIDQSLRVGVRGLPGGSSLARLLEKHRGVPNRKNLPPLPTSKILEWADAYHRRTGNWPQLKSGAIPEAPGETWSRVNGALTYGVRGQPGGSSLAQLLAAERAVRNLQDLPPLTVKQILAWADGHHRRTGQWPTRLSGPVHDAPGEDWRLLDGDLQSGQRGLSGGTTLAKLLAAKRIVPHPHQRTRLTVEQILAWADEFKCRTGAWPKYNSGKIAEASEETWNAIDHALFRGKRGLEAGSSVAKLLAATRGVRNLRELPPLNVEQILRWVDAFHERTGSWPKYGSGPIDGSHGETWSAVNSALASGLRDLPGGSSIARLLEARRGVRNRNNLPSLSVPQIAKWAKAHRRRFGSWPTITSGPVLDCPGQTWGAINAALREGLRGLPGGSSLAAVKRRIT